jgi:superfamily II DNA/RNA helicase
LGLGSVAESPYSAAVAAVDGIRFLQQHLVTGGSDALDSARVRLDEAIRAPFAPEDTDSRWVAALLADFGTAYGSTSIGSLLPPGNHNVHLAFTLGEPPVVLLWPPQAEMLSLQPSPFAAEVTRMVLSFPTSAGKTLLAQLLVCHHLAAAEGDVCFVAPTHSLCREVKAALDPRLLYLGTSAHDAGSGTGPDATPGDARVLIVTPERLSSMLRADPSAVLARYSMFVIDEAHMIAEAQRGWGLEEALTLLHHLTRSGPHRLIVMSAALGNSAHIAQWLETSDAPLTHHSDWRGPRRLQIIYAPEPVWDQEVQVPKSGARQPRRHIPLKGNLHLRPRGHGLMTGSFPGAGELVLRYAPSKGKWVKDDDASTIQVEQLIPMIQHLAGGTGSPCLVVVASRREAKKLAQMTADVLDDVPGNAPLAELVASRLPSQHPLPAMIMKGVAFHHGVLPREIQAEIEDATRRRQIRCLVATTTLTEGVNLPFRSVVIGTTGWGSGDAKQEVIDPARLLNAFGRAGRAGRETEGWLFYAYFGQKFTVDAFNVFDRTAADLEIVSTLLTEESLASLVTFEALLADGTDAVLADAGAAANGFSAYVWFVADVLSQLASPRPLTDQVQDVLRSTLAWRQFDDDRRDRWTEVAGRSLATYQATSAEKRQRWSRSGTSLHSAVVLESVAGDIRNRIVSAGIVSTADEWLQLVLDTDTLATLISLPENRHFRGIRPRFNASLGDALDIDYLEMLRRWVAGDELDVISEAMLTEIADEDFRADTLTEFVAAVFEHHLPWVVRTLVGWINIGLPDELKAPAALPAHIQFGVPTSGALELMTNGVRSRRLATVVAQILGADEPLMLRSRLQNMEVDEWRKHFGAAPTEIKDLLAYAHDPTLQPVARLLSGEDVFLPFLPTVDHVPDGAEAQIVQLQDGPEPRDWIVVVGGDRVGSMLPPTYMYVAALVGLGQALTITIDASVPRLIVTRAPDGPLQSS